MLIKILLLKIAILQLQLQLLTMPPEMPVKLRLGAVETKIYHTSTSTAEAYLQANSGYQPTFSAIKPNLPDRIERVYLRNDATGKLIDENHKYFYYIDPNTKIRYTKLISTNPVENYEWR